jgi:D-mannonate dehydratase
VDTVAYIAIGGALIVLAIGAAIIVGKIRRLETQVKALWPLEHHVADQNEVIKRLKTDIAAQNVTIEIQGESIKKLQAEVATWKWKFDAVIAWVRTVVPGKEVDRFLAQLEARQRGG